VSNEAIYVGIIAAGNAQTRPVIKKTSPETLATPVVSKDTKVNTRTHGRERRSQIKARTTKEHQKSVL
jgi:hypothetical protein